MTILNWEQAKAEKNLPIYYVRHRNLTLARIEYDLNEDAWDIYIFGKYHASLSGDVSESEIAKTDAERRLKARVEAIQEILTSVG